MRHPFSCFAYSADVFNQLNNYLHTCKIVNFTLVMTVQLKMFISLSTAFHLPVFFVVISVHLRIIYNKSLNRLKVNVMNSKPYQAWTLCSISYQNPSCVEGIETNADVIKLDPVFGTQLPQQGKNCWSRRRNQSQSFRKSL